MPEIPNPTPVGFGEIKRTTKETEEVLDRLLQKNRNAEGTTLEGTPKEKAGERMAADRIKARREKVEANRKAREEFIKKMENKK
jgi:hypothetical protein